MKNIIKSTPAAMQMIAGEVITGITGMISEIARYKRAIAELDNQREQMRYQAQIALQQIDAQLHNELKRIDGLSRNFEQFLRQNELLINNGKQHRHEAVILSQQIATAIIHCQDAGQSQVLLQMYSLTMQQLTQACQEMSELGQRLHDAHHQLGISISRRDRDWHDVS